MKMKKSKTNLSKLKEIGILLLIFSFSLNTFSQNKKEENTLGEKITIHSKILNEDRTILISLPDNYKNSDKEFPVLYALDGRTHFQHASGAANYLARQNITPGIIVVAVTNVDRNRDFTPVKDEARPVSGGAEKFHNFLKKELISYVEKNYRASKYKILMGHSLGGTFAAYSLLEYPDVFDAYIAVSPYLQYADNYINSQAELKLKKEYAKPKSFYMTVGEEPDYLKVLDEFSELIQEKSDNAIKFLYIQMQGENHGTTPYLSLFNGLRFIFSDWILPKEIYLVGLQAIDEHYKLLSDKYHYKITTPENTINLLGYQYLQAGETEKAIEIFKENVKRFPKSANVYDSLGEACEKNEQFKLAKKNYQKAYDLGIIQLSPAILIYKENLERVSKLVVK